MFVMQPRISIAAALGVASESKTDEYIRKVLILVAQRNFYACDFETLSDESLGKLLKLLESKNAIALRRYCKRIRRGVIMSVGEYMRTECAFESLSNETLAKLLIMLEKAEYTSVSEN